MRTPQQVKQMMLDSADQLLSIRTDKPELTGPRKTKTTHLIGHDELSSIPTDANVICVSCTINERDTMLELLPNALHIRCKDEESIQSGFDFTSAALFVDMVSDCTSDIYIVSQSGLDGRTLAMEKAIRLIRSQRLIEIACNEFIYQAILDEIAYRSGRP